LGPQYDHCVNFQCRSSVSITEYMQVIVKQEFGALHIKLSRGVKVGQSHSEKNVG